MRFFLFFFINFFLLFNLIGQDYLDQKYDRQLILTSVFGGACYNLDSTDTIYRRGVLFDYNEDTLRMQAIDTLEYLAEPYKIHTYGAVAQICDRQGVFTAHFNGIYLSDRHFNKTLLDVFEDPHNPGVYEVYYLAGGIVMLPHPGKENTYVIVGLNDYHYEPIYYQIPCPENISAVTFKSEEDGQLSIIDIIESLHHAEYQVMGAISTCRHANGRDWWIICPERFGSVMHYFLLDKNGVKYSHNQDVSVDLLSGSYFGKFSPDGKYYVRTKQVRDNLEYSQVFIQFFAFDRCAGLLTEVATFEPGRKTRTGIGSVIFAPNSRYFYALMCRELYQGDIEADDIQASMVHIADVDNTILDNFRPLCFGSGFSSPDGKIYIMDGNNHFRMAGVIHHPDERGLACGLEFGMPIRPACTTFFDNVPYFGLGPLDGSPCDTLGLDSPLALKDVYKETEEYKAWPNPSTGLIYVTAPDGFSGRLLITDSLGKPIGKYKFNQNMTIDLLDNNGIYFIQFLNQSGETVRTLKHVVLR